MIFRASFVSNVVNCLGCSCSIIIKVLKFYLLGYGLHCISRKSLICSNRCFNMLFYAVLEGLSNLGVLVMPYFLFLMIKQQKVFSHIVGVYDGFCVSCSLWFQSSFLSKKHLIQAFYSGNHAAAVSLAAKLRDIPAYIVIPKNAPKCKVENVKRYGGHIIWSEPTVQSREKTAQSIQRETDAVLIHPFNDGRTIRCTSS